MKEKPAYRLKSYEDPPPMTLERFLSFQKEAEAMSMAEEQPLPMSREQIKAMRLLCLSD